MLDKTRKFIDVNCRSLIVLIMLVAAITLTLHENKLNEKRIETHIQMQDNLEKLMDVNLKQEQVVDELLKKLLQYKGE